MFQFKLNTEIIAFDSAKEFAANMAPGEKDLIITNKVIWEVHLRPLSLSTRVVFQEDFGVGEPNDKMINGILSTISGNEFERVYAVGGGTVIDIAKLICLEKCGNVLDLLYGRTMPVKAHELVVVPTTCGTGSEVTNISIDQGRREATATIGKASQGGSAEIQNGAASSGIEPQGKTRHGCYRG